LVIEDLTCIITWHIVHHEILALVWNDKVIRHTREIWMTQRGEECGFTSELSFSFGGNKEIFFDRYFDTEAFIMSTVYCAHTATAKFFYDPIAIVKK
jgi:hypothetical protein